MLTLELDEDNRLKITLKSSTTRTFNLPIIELEEKDQKVPDLKFAVVIKTSSSLLNESIADVDVVGESVAFIAEPKKFILQAEGDLNRARIEIKDDEVTKYLLPAMKSTRRNTALSTLRR